MDGRGGSLGRWLARGLVLAGALLIALAVAAPTVDAAKNGNNGTVKVDGGDLTGNANEPHVGCVFNIEWFGFDAGSVTSNVTFAAQPPTGTSVLLQDQQTFTGGGQGGQLDHSASYDLSAALQGFTPQPQQGFHVKLTVNTPGSKGADVKHKTFWVSGCGGSTTTTSTSSTSTSTSSTSTSTSSSSTSSSTSSTTASTSPSSTTPSTTGTTVGGGVLGSSTTTPGSVPGSATTQAPSGASSSASVLGSEVTQGSATTETTTATSPEQLARTGRSTGIELFAGIVFVLSGVVLLKVGKRLHPVA